MPTTQPPTRPSQPAPPLLVQQGTPGWQFDDDLAIGCECAQPALQIERWAHEEAAQQVRALY